MKAHHESRSWISPKRRLAKFLEERRLTDETKLGLFSESHQQVLRVIRGKVNAGVNQEIFPALGSSSC